MASASSSKFSFLNTYTGPGGRQGHSLPAQQAPARTYSLPQLGIPAGYSQKLGNTLGLKAYANLRGPFNARLDVAIIEKDPNRVPVARREIRVEDGWTCGDRERIRPETLPPAGSMKIRPHGKKMVPSTITNLADTVIWGHVTNGSDSMASSHGPEMPIYQGAAGLWAEAANRHPLPPLCMRTFGEEGPRPWDPPAPAKSRSGSLRGTSEPSCER